MTRDRYTSLFALVAAFITPTGALAETVDYGSLEALFGEPVTTSATGKPQRASDVPVALEIITAEQIQRSGATSIPEVLNHVNGISTWHPTRSYWDVGVRGQNAAYNPSLLVLVNGRQVYIDISNYTDWSLLPVQMEEIRQIEVVKGPATALYGFNAVAGVVNIVTYNPKYDKVAEAGAVAGTGDYGRAYGYGTVKLSDNASVRFSGSSSTAKEFGMHSKTPYASVSTFANSINDKLMADGLVQLSDNTQLRLEASHVTDNSTDGFSYIIGVPSDKTFFSAKAALTTKSDYGLVDANLYTNKIHQTMFGPMASTIDGQLTVFQLQDLFKVGTDHTFRLQTEFRDNTLQGLPQIGYGAEIGYDLLAASGMWNWVVTPGAEWTNSLRVDSLFLRREGPIPANPVFTSNDQFDKTMATYSGNSGVSWKATDEDTLRASFGRGVGAPSAVLFGIIRTAGPNTYVVGDPGLNPTVVYNYEVGYDRQIAPIGGKFSSSVFYKQTKGVSSLNGNIYVAGPNTIKQSAAFGDSATKGVELGVNGKINPEWIWDIGYTYQTTSDDFIQGTGATYPYSFKYSDTVPRHVVKAHLGYATGPWTADVYGEADSRFTALYRTAFPGPYYYKDMNGYTTFSGRVSYRFENNITLGLQGEQLTQARLANNYGLENDRELYITLSKKF